jgi:hypothetical protein
MPIECGIEHCVLLTSSWQSSRVIRLAGDEMICVARARPCASAGTTSSDISPGIGGSPSQRPRASHRRLAAVQFFGGIPRGGEGAGSRGATVCGASVWCSSLPPSALRPLGEEVACWEAETWRARLALPEPCLLLSLQQKTQQKAQRNAVSCVLRGEQAGNRERNEGVICVINASTTDDFLACQGCGACACASRGSWPQPLLVKLLLGRVNFATLGESGGEAQGAARSGRTRGDGATTASKAVAGVSVSCRLRRRSSSEQQEVEHEPHHTISCQ